MKKTKNFASSVASSINSPIPTNLEDPGQGLDKIIPSSILEKAQGLAIYTVLKAGFLFSGRAGSGLVIARMVGSIRNRNRRYRCRWTNWCRIDRFCIGLEYKRGLAAGPIGRNAEASGSASLKHIAAIYSYSKTRGLFAGVSLEGSVVVTRSDANEKFYGKRVTAKELLNGTVSPPPEADALYRALNAKFHTLGTQTYARSLAENNGTLSRNQAFKSTNISAPGTLRSPPPLLKQQMPGYGAPMPPPGYQTPPQQQVTYNHNQYYNNNYENPPLNPSNNYQQSSAKREPPPPPPTRKPVAPMVPIARALYAYQGQQDGDLSFQEGEIITVIEKTNSQDDWWTGRIGNRQGLFPANYVQLQ
ncbi:hypothetical protein RO3G_08407 [Rhizopus delemar RA 99-880]|uniref:SH3 domain-containing protein n=1 Tax=Rhizopus delemar (strain RA 99-880 / ATCC MYA-4621 / FGSC 9543 / NRRL 43880) TaxID=246409 RepID=I1C5H2_RHIO9|nr:hypothetical protein RO3G_08407 [Rhizopus delemar RA 99-880]|eukprot:EIE83702.1 hypothetical protein RO3G_08407 [Rhizopus delemar RA 99-880]